MAQGTSSGIFLGLAIALISFVYVGVAFSHKVNWPTSILTWLYIIGPVSVVYLLKYILTIFIAIRLQCLYRIIPVRTWEVVTYATVASTPPFMDKAYNRMHLLAFTLAVISPGLARWGALTQYPVTHMVNTTQDTTAYGIGGCDMQLGRCYMCSNELLVNLTRTYLAGGSSPYMYIDPNTSERYMPMWPVIPGFGGRRNPGTDGRSTGNNDRSIGKDVTVYIHLNSIPGGVFTTNCSDVKIRARNSTRSGFEADNSYYPGSQRNRSRMCDCCDEDHPIWAGLPGELELDVNVEPVINGRTYKKQMIFRIGGPNMVMEYQCNATIQFHKMDAVWLLDKGTVRLERVDNVQKEAIESYSERLNNCSSELRVVYTNTFGYLWDRSTNAYPDAKYTIPKLFDAHIQTIIMRATGINFTTYINQEVKNATFTYVKELQQPGRAFTIACLSVASCATLSCMIWLAFACCEGGPLMFTGNILQVMRLYRHDVPLLARPNQPVKIMRLPPGAETGNPGSSHNPYEEEDNTYLWDARRQPPDVPLQQNTTETGQRDPEASMNELGHADSTALIPHMQRMQMDSTSFTDRKLQNAWEHSQAMHRVKTARQRYQHGMDCHNDVMRMSLRQVSPSVEEIHDDTVVFRPHVQQQAHVQQLLNTLHGTGPYMPCIQLHEMPPDDNVGRRQGTGE